jgi:hypothetical protein
MKSQKRRRLWPTPGCNAMEEEEVLSLILLNVMVVRHEMTSCTNMQPEVE